MADIDDDDDDDDDDNEDNAAADGWIVLEFSDKDSARSRFSRMM